MLSLTRKLPEALASLVYKFRFFAKNQFQKHLLTMNKVYFRRLPANNQLQINFRYKNDELNVDREFNFNRNFNEKIEICLDRMRANIEKECLKKFKKKKKVKQVESVKVNPNSRDNILKTIDNKVDIQSKQIQVQLLKNNLVVQNSTFSDIFGEEINYSGSNLVLKILEDNFEILYNKPWVSNISLPSCILSGYYVYPIKMELEFANKEDSAGYWYRGAMPTSNKINEILWTKIHNGFTYRTKNEDVGNFIKFELIPSTLDEYGPSAEVISKSVVQAGPGKCPFEDRHLFTQRKLSGDEFRVVTYNILADLYADSDYSRKQLFPYCPAYALNIDYRKQLFIKEIIGYNSDIICLQEVDCKVFDQDLVPIFETENLSGVMEKKGQSGEGVAIFYRNDRFDLIKEYGVNIGENIRKLDIFKDLATKISNNKKLLDRIQERATTLQVCLLQFKKNAKYIIVANTHLYFHPDADHIRLLQMSFCMLFVEDVYRKTIEQYKITPDNISVLFCGDFNSTPDSGIYKLMTNKFVDESCSDWHSNKSEAVKNVSLKQSFNIRSACGTPKYTNYTHLFSGCLDYIYYQTDNIIVNRITPLPRDDELDAHTAIPSVVFPSDHVSLVVDLKWKSYFFPK